MLIEKENVIKWDSSLNFHLGSRPILEILPFLWEVSDSQRIGLVISFVDGPI